MSANDCIASPFFNQSTELLSSSPRNRFPNHVDSCYEHMHELEKKFCKDFSCCGLNLENLHDLLEHFEEYHSMNTEGMTDRTAASDEEMDSSSNNSSTLRHTLHRKEQLPHPQAACSVVAAASDRMADEASILSATASPTIYQQTIMAMMTMDDNHREDDVTALERSFPFLLQSTATATHMPSRKQHLTRTDLALLENANTYAASKTKVETLDSIKDGHPHHHHRLPTPTRVGSAGTHRHRSASTMAPPPPWEVDPKEHIENSVAKLTTQPTSCPSFNKSINKNKKGSPFAMNTVSSGSNSSRSSRSDSSNSSSSSSSSSSSDISIEGKYRYNLLSITQVDVDRYFFLLPLVDTEDRPYRCHVADC
ncbi:hypothetical protein BDF20DRAFT_885091, partial [Mycotypha africana]|uniref:uncharacterized protein n=1 Tax=Mycotypha africana TaxID=64632 RepID=UPI0023004C65